MPKTCISDNSVILRINSVNHYNTYQRQEDKTKWKKFDKEDDQVAQDPGANDYSDNSYIECSKSSESRDDST